MNVYELVTQRILDQMAQGVIPWQKPWTGVRPGAYNRISKKPYSLLNQLLLSKEGEYATFRQWKALGGNIRKGAKSEAVVFWKLLDRKAAADDRDDGTKKIPVLRYYRVFHVSDVDGVEPLPQENLHNTHPLQRAEQVFRAYVQREGIQTEQALSNHAFYSPRTDCIHLPDIRQFAGPADYYSVAFHESAHSTGHPSRLGRFSLDNALPPFGSGDYSKEELTAELGSAAVMNLLGLETSGTLRNSAAYIASWTKALQDDTRFIVSASSKADNAVRCILGERSGMTGPAFFHHGQEERKTAHQGTAS